MLTGKFRFDKPGCQSIWSSESPSAIYASNEIIRDLKRSERGYYGRPKYENKKEK